MKKTTALLVAATLGLAACSGAAAQELRGTGEHAPMALEDATALDAVLAQSARFGYDVLTHGPADVNVVVSPASLTTAFAMLGPGASGAGEQELTRLLGASPSDAADAVNALLGSLAHLDGDPAEFDPEEVPDTPFLHIASRAVVREGYEIQQSYLDALVRYFDAGVGTADFADPASKEVLSEWVNHHTAGLIPESGITPNPDLVLVLQNALLLAAAWSQPFEDGDTYQQTFTPAEGAGFQVDMMHGTASVPHVISSEGWQAIRLPYTEGLFATFVLPPEGTDPGAVDAAQLADMMTQLEGALDEATSQDVDLILPVLDAATDIELVDVLQDLGYTAIFDASTNPFAGIGEGLAIDQAVHQTVLRVDEEGTVGAAVTEIAVGEMAAPPPQEPNPRFVADRPYLMVVNAPGTGWDLFQTVVRDPRS